MDIEKHCWYSCEEANNVEQEFVVFSDLFSGFNGPIFHFGEVYSFEEALLDVSGPIPPAKMDTQGCVAICFHAMAI